MNIGKNANHQSAPLPNNGNSHVPHPITVKNQLPASLGWGMRYNRSRMIAILTRAAAAVRTTTTQGASW